MPDRSRSATSGQVNKGNGNVEPTASSMPTLNASAPLRIHSRTRLGGNVQRGAREVGLLLK
jgi:hypothetical protein